MKRDPTNKQRQARHRQRLRNLGLARCQLDAPMRWHPLLAQMARAISDNPLISKEATEFLVYWRDGQGRLHPLKELIP